MKTFGWIVAIGIVLYLIGRKKSDKPAEQQGAQVPKSPVDSLLAQTSALANTAGDMVYKIASDFTTPLNSELIDQQPIFQQSVNGGDFLITRPVEEKIAGIPPVKEERIPRAENKWWPDIMYTNRPPWNEHYPDENGECVCGNGCVVLEINMQ